VICTTNTAYANHSNILNTGRLTAAKDLYPNSRITFNALLFLLRLLLIKMLRYTSCLWDTHFLT